MKTHARNFGIGAVLVPIALAVATLIANEAQTLIGLHLDNVALAIYLVPFLAGAAMAVAALLRLEATKIGGELGNVLGDLASNLFGPPPDAPAPSTPMPPIVPSATGAGPPAPQLPPPSTPPAP